MSSHRYRFRKSWSAAPLVKQQARRGFRENWKRAMVAIREGKDYILTKAALCGDRWAWE